MDFSISEPSRLTIEIADLRQPLCDNSVGLVDFAPTGGTPPYEIYWADGGTSSFRDDLGPGEHEVRITDANGCTLDTVFSIIEKEVDFEVDVLPLRCSESYDAELTIHVSGAAEPFVVTADSIIIYNGRASVHAGRYTITLVDADGCIYQEEIEVEDQQPGDIFIASAFTPNNDGLNDYFEVKGDRECLSGARFEIFSRWGERIFETDRPLDVFWDGTIMGHPAKSDIYMYIFTSGGTEQKGYFKVLR